MGISLASRVTYIFVCVTLLCVKRRAGTSIFGYSAGVGGGTVRVFFFFSWLCFGLCGTFEQVGVAGQYGFSSFPGFVLAGTVRLKWWGRAVFKFPLSSVWC